jgi:hypothetical protein
MDPIEIPTATTAGKVVVIGCCVLIVVAVLAWSIPKFKSFLLVVLGKAPRSPGTKTIHLILGFLVYALIFAPVYIAGRIALHTATTPSTLLSGGGWR